MKLIRIYLLLSSIVFLIPNTYSTNYTVNSNAGTSSGAGTSGSLLYCIAQANLSAGPHNISFAAAMAGQTITCAGFGNYIFSQSNITLDATTLPGYTCGLPVIKIDVSGVGGFRFSGSNNMVKGIAFMGWVLISGGTGNSVQGCTFHIELNGTTVTTPATLGQATIYITGGSGNKIGGYTDCERNIIASVGARAFFDDGSAGSNVFKGNYCGTLRDGLTATTAASFTAHVVYMKGNSSTAAAGDSINGNIIGRGTMGIFNDGAGKTFIYNNNVGANKNRLFQATLALTNIPIGFDDVNASNSEIDGNVSGNTSYLGGYAFGANIGVFDAGNDNFKIRNNYVGVDINFNKSGAAWCGIFTRGSTATITGNYVGDNGIRYTTQYSHGIGTEGASNCTISNNYVGVTPSGANIGNGDAGIEINGGSNITISNNVIGFNKGMRTTLSGSAGSGGIQLIAGPTSITISSNYIGTTPSIIDCGNLVDGIYTEKGTTVTISQNKIAYNDRNGINLAPKVGGGGSGPSNYVWVTQNCMWCNTSKGILLTTGGQNNAAAGATSYGESFTIPTGTYSAVTINSFTAATNKSDSTTTPGTLVIKGYSPASAYIELFKVEPCKGCGSTGNEEGQVYLGTTQANASGLWSFSMPTNNIGRGIVATASSSNASPAVTSEFSSCLSLTNQCNILSSVAMSPTNGPIPICSGTSISFTGSYTAKPYAGCPNMFNVTWYKDATVLSGPTQNSSGSSSYSKVAAASGDDGIYAFAVSDALPQAPACLTKDTAKVVYDCGLKINLISFSGVSLPEENKIMWTLDSDKPGAVEIERSNNINDFKFLQKINFGKGLVNEMTFDKTDDPIVYYRLKIHSTEDKEFYSNIIVIDRNTPFKIDIIQDKPEDWLTVNVLSNIDQMINYKIFDIRGVNLSESSFMVQSGTSKQKIYIGNIPKAVYIIKFEAITTGDVDNKKFLH